MLACKQRRLHGKTVADRLRPEKKTRSDPIDPKNSRRNAVLADFFADRSGATLLPPSSIAHSSAIQLQTAKVRAV